MSISCSGAFPLRPVVRLLDIHHDPARFSTTGRAFEHQDARPDLAWHGERILGWAAVIVCTQSGVHEIQTIQEVLQRRMNNQQRGSFRCEYRFWFGTEATG